MIEKVRLRAYNDLSRYLGGDAMKSLDVIAGVKINTEEPMGQLVTELDKAESKYRHVPLAEFRDQVLPQSGFDWAKDSAKVKSLLKDAIDRDLVLTYRMLLTQQYHGTDHYGAPE